MEEKDIRTINEMMAETIKPRLDANAIIFISNLIKEAENKMFTKLSILDFDDYLEDTSTADTYGNICPSSSFQVEDLIDDLKKAYRHKQCKSIIRFLTYENYVGFCPKCDERLYKSEIEKCV